MGPNSNSESSVAAAAAAASTVLGDAERIGDAFHSVVDRLKAVRATVTPLLAHPMVPTSLADAFKELVSIVGDIHQAVAELMRPCECAEPAQSAPAPIAAEPVPASIAGLTVVEGGAAPRLAAVPADELEAFRAWHAQGGAAGAAARAAQDAINGQG